MPKITIWCQCGDGMQEEPTAKFQVTYGKAYNCFGCDRTIYLDKIEFKNDPKKEDKENH